jgi:hypothetical protein
MPMKPANRRPVGNREKSPTKAERAVAVIRPIAGDGQVALDEEQIVGEPLELSLAIVDFGVEVSDFRGQAEQGGVKGLWERLEWVGQGGGQARQDVARALGNGDTELAQGAADGVQARGARGDPGRAGAVERSQGVLVKSLDGDRNDLLIAMSFQKGAGIGAVGLVAQDVAAGLVRGQQQDPVPEALDLPGPVVGRAAGLQQYGGPLPPCEEGLHLATPQPLAFADAPRLVGHGNLENRLGQIHRDGRMLLHGLLLSRVTL